MLIIQSVIFHHDFNVFGPDLPVKQSEQSIEHDRDAEVEHKSENDRADEILKCHVGFNVSLSSLPLVSSTDHTIENSTNRSEITPSQNPLKISQFIGCARFFLSFATGSSSAWWIPSAAAALRKQAGKRWYTKQWNREVWVLGSWLFINPLRCRQFLRPHRRSLPRRIHHLRDRRRGIGNHTDRRRRTTRYENRLSRWPCLYFSTTAKKFPRGQSVDNCRNKSYQHFGIWNEIEKGQIYI